MNVNIQNRELLSAEKKRILENGPKVKAGSLEIIE